MATLDAYKGFYLYNANTHTLLHPHTECQVKPNRISKYQGSRNMIGESSFAIVDNRLRKNLLYQYRYLLCKQIKCGNYGSSMSLPISPFCWDARSIWSFPVLTIAKNICRRISFMSPCDGRALPFRAASAKPQANGPQSSTITAFFPTSSGLWKPIACRTTQVCAESSC